MKRQFAAGITAMACAIIMSCSCTRQNSNSEGLAIYLTKEEISPTQTAVLNQASLQDQPFIAGSDILSYNAQTHELKLSQDAFTRIVDLAVPVQGKTFVVCVDKEPVYRGAFWTPISSISFDGVTIWKPLDSQEPYVITLELGYPSSSFYGGKDPRGNPAILQSLEKAGKLIDKLSISQVSMLPHGMKGYELYSRLTGDVWHFTLITGTNRNKTIDELTSGEDYISESGWINVHMVGVDDIKLALSRLPPGEEIFWLVKPRIDASTSSQDFTLPPQSVVDDIKAQASRDGLILQLIS